VAQPGGQLPRLSTSAPSVPVELVGEALQAVEEIIAHELPGSTPTDVVYRGIALMRAAIGKQVELRDPANRTVQVVDLWGRR
jgi:phage tail tape-measure protein